MAYLIFTANGEEYDRRELRAPVTLGRAPDCDISIPDITLSRHHCRIERSENGKGWQIVDMQSKNGTHYLGRPIECHVFRERDELRLGRTRLTFREGAFVQAPSLLRRRGVIRPCDPHEALAGTVSGMVLCEPGETEKYEGMPVPQPRPSDPSSFEKDDVYGMINEIVSSSWDSIQAQASQPLRMQRAMPVPAMTNAQRTARPKPRVSFCLQAEHNEATNVPAVAPPAPAKRSLNRWRRPAMLVAVSVAVTGLFVTAPPRLARGRIQAHRANACQGRQPRAQRRPDRELGRSLAGLAALPPRRILITTPDE
jgi:pSer/pThr/pTyr-binding forkhead associated (FHA) protein